MKKINELHRKNQIANFLNRLEESNSCLLFYGSSGVGKTTFLKQVNDSLKNSGYYSLYISFNKPEKDILQELLDFAKNILSVEVIAKNIIKDLKNNKHQYIRKLTLSLINDIVKLAVPISDIVENSDTYKELEHIIGKTSLSEIEKQIQLLEYDLFPFLLSAIQEYSNYLDKKTYIIYDQVESNPTGYLKQIRESLSNPNKSLCQILSIQKELLQSNIELSKFITGIKRFVIKDYTLNGFNKKEVKEWFDQNSLTYNCAALDELIKITEGKPIYLVECINSEKIDSNKIRNDVEEGDGGYFADYFDTYQEPEQKLIIALCFQPQNYILTDKILMQLANLKAAAFDNFKNKLEKMMLISKDATNDLCSIDLHYCKVNYIFRKNKNTVQEIANELKKLLEKQIFSTIQEQKHFFSIILHLSETDIKFVFNRFTQFDIEKDCIPLDWVKKVKKNEGILSITERIRLNAIYAKSYYLVGKYAEAIEHTKLNIKNETDKINLLDYCLYKLNRGRNHFRESKYNEAIKDLHFAAQIFKEIEKWDEYVECIKTIATIYRDKGNYEKAYINSRELYDALKDVPLKSTSASYICRNYIRSSIMVGKLDKLKEPLKKSFDVVQNVTDSVNERDLANCYFTEGEYYRYRKDFKKSMVSYENAMLYARRINNPDTEIYALLGKCDSLIHLNEYQKLHESIKLLNEVLNLYNYEKSSLEKSALEILHLNLLINVFSIFKERGSISVDSSFGNVFSQKELLNEYAERGIIWVQKFWSLFEKENKLNNIMKF